MTSTSRAKPFYGPINPAILGAFEWEDDEPTGQTAVGHTTGVNLLRYLPFNPALLGGFDDRDQSAPSTTATDRGRDRVEEVPKPVEPVTTTTKSHSPLRGSRRFLARVLSSAVGNVEPRPRGVRKRQDTSPKARRRESSTTHTESDTSTNPHTAVIEDKQNSVTVAFLRDQEAVSPVDVSCSLSPDDLSLGQRYQVTAETATVVITNQRKLPDVLSGDRECIICTDTKPVSEFPAIAITAACDHTPTTCLVCIATSIRTDLSSRLWNEIKCPECRATLQYDDVQRFADDETKERYQTLSFRSALSLSPTFLWCTSGCGYGQVHEGGLAQPIVICLLCHHRSCFHHKVAWHENLTCDEYDALLTDPANFRSRFDIENEEAEKAAAARRAQEDADRVFAQGLVAREQRAVVEERERKERERREAVERREREERERRERAEREERERREREVREEMMRRKKEEEASQRTVEGTTKPCPGCSAPIEKNAGCAHMTCTRCQHGFCWDCLADHKQILESDNTAHKKECPWHPDNIKDDTGS